MKKINYFFYLSVIFILFSIIIGCGGGGGEGGDGVFDEGGDESNIDYAVPYATITLDGNGNDWADIDAVENDPQGDDISDYSGADIKCYKVAQDQNNIYIWSEMWDGSPNSIDFRGGHFNPNWYQYHLLGGGDSIAAVGVSYDGVMWSSSLSSATVACGSGIELSIPKSALGGVSSFDIKIDIIIGGNGETADSTNNWITLLAIEGGGGESSDSEIIGIYATADVYPSVYVSHSFPGNRFDLGAEWGTVYAPPIPWQRVDLLIPEYTYYCLVWSWDDAPAESKQYIVTVDAVNIGGKYYKVVGCGHANYGSSIEDRASSDVTIGTENDGLVYTQTLTASVSDGKISIFIVLAEDTTISQAASTSEIIKQGQFSYGNISGLQYSSGNQSGYTDANGMFEYEEGKTIKFFIGSINIGETNGKSIITPLDLVPNGSVSHQKVINICRFLLTLDSDNDPDNGIVIPAEARTNTSISINFDVSEKEFEDSDMVQTFFSEVKEASFIISSNFAQNYLQDPLNIIDDLLYTAEWTFTEITLSSTGECHEDVGGENTHEAQLDIRKDGSALFTTISHTEASDMEGETISGQYENNKLIFSLDNVGYNCGPFCNENPCDNGELTMELIFSDINNITGTMEAYSCCADNGHTIWSITGMRP
ncbi:MAG: hypothetical protein ACMUIP_05520 [bacterium]